MQQVQAGVKGFVAGAHEEQHNTIRIIQPHNRIPGHVDEFVTGFSLQEGRMQVYPVAGYVDRHAQLKPEDIVWIEYA